MNWIIDASPHWSPFLATHSAPSPVVNGVTVPSWDRQTLIDSDIQTVKDDDWCDVYLNRWNYLISDDLTCQTSFGWSFSATASPLHRHPTPPKPPSTFTTPFFINLRGVWTAPPTPSPPLETGFYGMSFSCLSVTWPLPTHLLPPILHSPPPSRRLQFRASEDNSITVYYVSTQLFPGRSVFHAEYVCTRKGHGVKSAWPPLIRLVFSVIYWWITPLEIFHSLAAASRQPITVKWRTGRSDFSGV